MFCSLSLSFLVCFVSLYIVLYIILCLCLCICVFLFLSPSPLPPTIMSQTPPQHIAFINEKFHQNFSWNGDETVHNSIDRVTDTCTRRTVISDNEKLSLRKSRIFYDESNLAGFLVRSDTFASITSFNDFTSEFRNHLQSHSKLGATHSLLKLSSSITQHARSLSRESYLFP